MEAVENLVEGLQWNQRITKKKVDDVLTTRVLPLASSQAQFADDEQYRRQTDNDAEQCDEASSIKSHGQFLTSDQGCSEWSVGSQERNAME
jgi:hypothetical protein